MKWPLWAMSLCPTIRRRLMPVWAASNRSRRPSKAGWARRVGTTSVHDLDADRVVVHSVHARPEADTRLVGRFFVTHHLDDLAVGVDHVIGAVPLLELRKVLIAGPISGPAVWWTTMRSRGLDPRLCLFGEAIQTG